MAQTGPCCLCGLCHSEVHSEVVGSLADGIIIRGVNCTRRMNFIIYSEKGDVNSPKKITSLTVYTRQMKCVFQHYTLPPHALLQRGQSTLLPTLQCP